MLRDQINTVAGGAEALIGSGRLGTPIDPENIKHLYLVEAGYKFTTEITRAVIRGLQKTGQAVPLLDCYDVAWAPEENQRRTAPNSGTTKKARAGLYALTAIFANGIHFQKVLESLEGSNRWQLIVVDDEDNLFGSTGRNDEFKGWHVANFEVNPYQFKQGAEGGTTSVYIQLGRSSEINKDIAYITPDHLDFLPSDIDGVNQVRLDMAAPAAGTSIVVKTVLDKDNSTFIAGLTATNFMVKVAGVTVEATVAENAEAKTYTFTVPAMTAEQTVEVKLYDTAGNSSVIAVGTAPEDVLYQSKEVTGVVTA